MLGKAALGSGAVDGNLPGFLQKQAVEEKKVVRNILCRFLEALTMAGVLILLTGLYYMAIKAGIPAQDPPLELQIQYAVNMGIGEVLTGNGFKLAVCSGVLRFIVRPR